MRTSASIYCLAVLPVVTACGGSDDDGDDGNRWSGRTYLLDVPSESWSEPAQIGAEIGDFVPQFLLEVQGSSPEAFDVLTGTAREGVQDPCSPTSTIAAVSEMYPSVTIGPADFPARIQHVTEDISVNATIYDLRLRDVLPDGDTPSTSGELSAVVDARELYPLFTLLINPNPDSLCAALGAFASCEPCATDGESYCLSLRAEGLGAAELPDVRIEPVDADDLDPACPMD